MTVYADITSKGGQPRARQGALSKPPKSAAQPEEKCAATNGRHFIPDLQSSPIRLLVTQKTSRRRAQPRLQLELIVEMQDCSSAAPPVKARLQPCNPTSRKLKLAQWTVLHRV